MGTKATYYALVHPNHGRKEAAPRLYLKRSTAEAASKQGGSDPKEYDIQEVHLEIPDAKGDKKAAARELLAMAKELVAWGESPEERRKLDEVFSKGMDKVLDANKATRAVLSEMLEDKRWKNVDGQYGGRAMRLLRLLWKFEDEVHDVKR